MRRAAVAFAAAVSLVLVGTGCGVDKLAEKATEKGVEKAIEKAAEGKGEGDVDIDVDEGTFSYEGEDGSMTMGGGEIPESFPEDLPLPDDFTVVNTMDVSGGDGYAQLVVHTSGSVEELAAMIKQGLEDGGYTIKGTREQSMEGIDNILYTAAGGGNQVMITVTDNVSADDEDLVMISYTITAEEE